MTKWDCDMNKAVVVNVFSSFCMQCLQEVIDRANDVERQASHALDLCFAGDARGTPQELEAERLLLVSSTS